MNKPHINFINSLIFIINYNPKPGKRRLETFDFG